MQGDVFRDVLVPGLADEPISVMIAAHPCSMRRGARLAERIAVAPVKPCEKIKDSTWEGYANFMLLPALLDDGVDYAADFRSIASAPSSHLVLDKRIAAMSPDGLLILQQRSIHFWTRFRVPLSDLELLAAPIFTECELQRDWVEAALDAQSGADPLEVAAKAQADFHQWLDENDRERRGRLNNIPQLAPLRREARQEASRRYM